MDYIENVREGRSSPAVLIASIIKIRGRRPDDPIFIFEGVDDIGVYREWLRSITPELVYQCVPGRGKAQLIKLIDKFRGEKLPIARRVWFFVDRDFDGLRGRPGGDDVYVCERYSAENYLLDRRVAEDYLIDELRCAHDIEERESVLEKFQQFADSLAYSLKNMNERLFVAKRVGIEVRSKKERLGQYLTIRVDGSEFTGDAKEVVVLEREFDASEQSSQQQAFYDLVPLLDYRGKWLFWAFKGWLDLLYEDRRSPSPTNFSTSVSELGPSPRTMELRQFASRAPAPTCLAKFLGGVLSEISEKSAQGVLPFG